MSYVTILLSALMVTYSSAYVKGLSNRNFCEISILVYLLRVKQVGTTGTSVFCQA